MSDSAEIFREAVKKNHPFFQPRSDLTLTPSVFGKMIALAWAERNGRSDLPPRSTVVEEFINSADDAPSSISSVMHIEDTFSGPTIAEFTDYMVAAQSDGLVSRYNPAHVRTSVEVDKQEAIYLINAYKKQFPDVVKWVQKRVKRLSEPNT